MTGVSSSVTLLPVVWKLTATVLLVAAFSASWVADGRGFGSMSCCAGRSCCAGAAAMGAAAASSFWTELAAGMSC